MGAVLRLTVLDTIDQKDQDRDGQLSKREFWVVDDQYGGEDLSEEEHSEFAVLDVDKDGLLSETELMHWESGRYHTEDAMKKMFELADRDNDMHLTADEIALARKLLVSTDAQYHLIEWAEHHEL